MLGKFLARRLPPKRKPDRLIGGDEKTGPYLLRWFLIPRNRLFNIYVHQYRQSDDDRALHDHPWLSLSYCIAGPLGEVIRKPDGSPRYRTIRAGQWVYRSARFAHRLVLLPDTTRDVEGHERVGPLTLFITGPVVRSWGFYCPKGWRHWRIFTAGTNGEQIGKGCD
jgi:hypothetical protein